MPRRKRARVKEEDQSEGQQKKQKTSPETRRLTRTVLREEPPSSTSNTNGSRERGKRSKPVNIEEQILISDSSDLSDAPSEIAPPTPPKAIKPALKGMKPVAKKSPQIQKPTSKEHEEALDKFIRDDSDDDLSDTSSETKPMNGVAAQSEEEDDEDWEDVDLSHRKDLSLDDLNGSDEPAGLEVTLERTQQSMRIKNKASSAAEKKLRMHTHLLHVQCLLYHGAIRNSWINDPELQRDLLSKAPDVTKAWKKCPSAGHRKDQCSALLHQTADRFRSLYTITKPGLRKYFEQFEQFKNIEEFRKAAKELNGSRDFGAQLFTALLRALGLETRLIFSLQPLGFNFGKQEDAHRLDRKRDDLSKDLPDEESNTAGTPKTTPKKRKRKHIEEDDDGEEDLGLPKVKSQKVSGPDSDLTFPIFWSEVYVEGSWIPIDALVLNTVASTSKQFEQFEPKGKVAEEKKLVMGYVVAYEADRYAKDVTVRYVKNYPSKAKRWRVREFSIRGAQGQTVMYDWFKRTLGFFRRAEKSDRDLIEDAELVVKPPAPKEVNLDSLSYYKNHPTYVLERHLRREEALKAGSKAVRTFTSGKGDKAREEVVYNRKDVYICRTVENWYKEGKREGETPMKQVKARPMTLTRKREHELAMAENDDQPIMEGLYAAHQVELYRPPPIENGIIPKNAYGNIDLFVDTMLPDGAVHLPYRGIAKVAKKLEIDYSEAITGFEFKKQRAIPVVTGAVVAVENEEMVLDAWRQEEAIRVEKEATKKQKDVLARWRKFLVGLRIRKRVGIAYGENVNAGA